MKPLNTQIVQVVVSRPRGAQGTAFLTNQYHGCSSFGDKTAWLGFTENYTNPAQNVFKINVFRNTQDSAY